MLCDEIFDLENLEQVHSTKKRDHIGTSSPQGKKERQEFMTVNFCHIFITKKMVGFLDPKKAFSAHDFSLKASKIIKISNGSGPWYAGILLCGSDWCRQVRDGTCVRLPRSLTLPRNDRG